jgi:APA family basic amino acid/polyamine antiporter
MKNSVSSEQPGLERHLGLATTTLLGIGVILGAGIYVIIGAAAGRAGNAVWASFLLAAAAATLTGLSYARLGRLRPKNAPEYQYLNLAFGRMPGFLAGWMVLWSVVISAAAVALGFAGYLQNLFNAPVLAGAIGLIVVASLIVFIGIRQSALAAGILTGVEILGLVLIIGIGAPYIGDVDLLEAPGGFQGVITAASLVFFAYLGFESMANLAEEMKNPGRDLPRAIILAILVSTMLYLLVALAAVSVVGWRELSDSSAPLATVAASALGTEANTTLTAIALASTANTVVLLLLAASRAMWAMSCAGVIPGFFCTIGEDRRTPWVAIAVVAVIASLFAAVRNIERVAEFTNFAVLLAFAGVNASAIKIFAAGGKTSAFKHFLRNRLLPGAGLVTALLLAATTGWRAALLGLVLLVIGGLLYVVFGKLGRKQNQKGMPRLP